MISAVADTHAAVWYLSGDARLSVTAAAIIDEAAQLGRKIAISSISLAELIYLVDKGRLDEKAYLDLRRALADARHVFLECLFTGDVVEAMRRVPRSEVPDMPDRMIAATAVFLGVPIISRDGRIRTSSIQSIW